MIDCFTQDWRRSVIDSGRCYHHQYFKTLLNTERYLSIHLPVKLVSVLRYIETNMYSHTSTRAIINFVLKIIIFRLLNVNFHCSKFTNVRNQYLYNWYTIGRNLDKFRHCKNQQIILLSIEQLICKFIELCLILYTYIHSFSVLYVNFICTVHLYLATCLCKEQIIY